MEEDHLSSHTAHLFDDPLAFIDPMVDLDSVARRSGRIGDAMKILCTHIPGKYITYSSYFIHQ